MGGLKIKWGGEILQVHGLFKLSTSSKSKNQTYFARRAARYLRRRAQGREAKNRVKRQFKYG